MLYPLIFFFFYLPFQLATNIAPGYDLASIRILAILLFLFWLFQSLARKKLYIPNKIQTLFLISFLFFNSLSLFFADNLDWGIRKLFFLFSFFPLYFVLADVVSSCHSERRAKNPGISKIEIQSNHSGSFVEATQDDKIIGIIKALIFGAGLISMFGIFQFLLQFILGVDPTLKLLSQIIAPFLGSDFSQSVLKNPSWMVNIGKDYMRAIAFFPDPHIFAFYLNMILPFSVVLFFKSKKYLYLLISIFILSADLLTFSRGGYLGLLAGLVVALILIRTKVSIKISIKKKWFLIIAFLLILSTVFLSPVRNRLLSSFDISEGSNQGRLETWQQSLGVIINNPLLGVGIGNYPLAIKPSADYRDPIYSHNLYFDIAAETGILNALIFIFLILSSIRSFYQNRMLNFYAYAGIVSLVAFSVHALFETPLYSVHILPLLLLIIALSTTQSKNVIPAKACLPTR